jgi:hypothetical protein
LVTKQGSAVAKARQRAKLARETKRCIEVAH